MNDLTERDRLQQIARTCAGINLRRASQAITNYYDGLFQPAFGLRATQIPPLVVLYLAGPQTINEIAKRLDRDRTTLTRNLKPLEEAGLIQIAPGEDQRTRVVVLSEKGEKVLLKALPVWEKVQAHVVLGIGEERFRFLLTHLSNITELTREE